MSELANLQIKVSSEGIGKAERELDRLERQSGKAESRIITLADQSAKANDRLAKLAAQSAKAEAEFKTLSDKTAKAQSEVRKLSDAAFRGGGSVEGLAERLATAKDKAAILAAQTLAAESRIKSLSSQSETAKSKIANLASASEMAASDLKKLKDRSAIAKQNLKDLEDQAKESAGATNSLSRAFNASTGAIGGYFGVLKRIVGASAAVAVATTAIVVKMSSAGKEIEYLSKQSGLSVEAFQAAAYATNQFGISAEKLADISKDATDKLGDFIATGAGEFKDFFENVAPKVGLTAEELQGLSGTEVLGAVKSAMDAANISAEEQVFYLEAIANDASRLSPLLADNNRLLKEQTDRYIELNAAMSQTEIDTLKEMHGQLNLLGDTLQKVFSVAIVGVSEDMNRFIDLLIEGAQWAVTFVDSFGGAPVTLDGTKRAIASTKEEIQLMTAELKKAEDLKRRGLAGRNDESIILLNPRKIQEANQQLEQLEKRIVILAGERKKLQQESAGVSNVGGVGEYGPVIPKDNSDKAEQARIKAEAELKAKQEASAKALEQLKSQLDSEEKQILDSYNRRRTAIDELVLSEQNIKAAGFENEKALREHYHTENLARLTSENEQILQKNQELLDRKAEQEEAARLAAEEANKTSLQKFIEDAEKNAATFEGMWGNTFNNFTSSFGRATADAIVDGEDFGDAMMGVAQGLAKSMIAALVEIAAQKMVLWGLEKTLGVSAAAGQVAAVSSQAATQVAMAGLNAFASTAAIPIVGPGMAPAAATAATGIASGFAAAAIAAAGSGIAGARSHGGQAIGGSAYKGAEFGMEMFQGQSGASYFIPPENGKVVPNHKLGSGGGATTVNVINNSSEQAETKRSTDGNGNEVIDIIIGKISDQVERGVGFGNTLQNTYGLNRRL